MNTTVSNLKQSPLFYLVLIPLSMMLFIVSYYVSVGHSYFSVSSLQNSVLILSIFAVWVLTLMLALYVRFLQNSQRMKSVSSSQKMLYVGLAVLLAGMTFVGYATLPSNWVLFSLFCLIAVACVMISISQNRWLYTTFGVSIVVLPILLLAYRPWRIQNIEYFFFGGGYYTQGVAKNLSNSVLLGAANADWYHIGSGLERLFFLKLIHSIGYIPAFLLIALLLSVWIIAVVKIYRFQAAHPFWQSLAFYLGLFFIIETVAHILSNLNIFQTPVPTSAMPFSNEITLWVLFIAFGFSSWKMRKSPKG